MTDKHLELAATLLVRMNEARDSLRALLGDKFDQVISQWRNIFIEQQREGKSVVGLLKLAMEESDDGMELMVLLAAAREALDARPECRS